MLLKKVVTSLLTIFLVFSFIAVAKAETEYPPYNGTISFKDMKGGHGAMWDILFLYKKGIIGAIRMARFSRMNQSPVHKLPRCFSGRWIFRYRQIRLPASKMCRESRTTTGRSPPLTIRESARENGYMRPAEPTTRAQRQPPGWQLTFHWSRNRCSGMSHRLTGPSPISIAWR